MRPLVTSIAALALTSPALFAQKPGDPVTPEALGKLEWVQGSAPTAWEPGKLYVLECWATWCGPCVAAIPHVDALYDKYSSQGLRVIGVNVWEDGKDKVAEFVKKKGDGMSYPVAYTGKGGVFEIEWLDVAGVRGIPHAFVVKDGKVLATTHPARLTEEAIEGLLKGGEAQDKVVATLAEKPAAGSGKITPVGEIRKAISANDFATAETKLKELAAKEPANDSLPLLWTLLHMAKGEWDAASKTLADIPETKARNLAAFNLTITPVYLEKAPPAFLTQVADGYEGIIGSEGSPGHWLTVARLRWNANTKDQAIAAAEKALAAAGTQAHRKLALEKPCQRLVESMKAGEYPDPKIFNEWVKEARGAAH